MFKKKLMYLASLQKLLHSNASFIDLAAEQEHRVDTFFLRLASDFKVASDKKEKEDAQKKMEDYADLAVLTYRRDTLWQKITRSKKNPEFKFLKDKKDIFEALLKRDVAFQERFGSFLDMAIKNEKRQIALQKEVRRRDKNRGRKAPNYRQIYDEEGDFIPDRLALVHVTRYKPKKDQNGCYALESLATATNLAHPRNTLHFTIGHHVNSHLAGAWDDAPYVIIAPMKETMTKCGKPLGISSVDTFFEVGLNEDMHLPLGTHLIEPSNKKLPNGIFSVTRGNRTIYKQTGFTERERAFLGMPENASDEQVASFVKKETTKEILLRLGYVQSDFDRVDSLCAQRVANMGKKLGIPYTSTGAALHACVALSGINRLGHGINQVSALITEAEKMFQSHSPSEKRQKEIFNELAKVQNLDAYMETLKKSDMNQKLGFTQKEIEVYEAWKKKAQEKITALLKKRTREQSADKSTFATQAQQNRHYR